MKRLLNLAKKFLAMPPSYMWMRLGAEVSARSAKHKPGDYEHNLDLRTFLGIMQVDSLQELHDRICAQRMPWAKSVSAQSIERWSPNDKHRLICEAEFACELRVNLLGSGPVCVRDETSGKIDWFKDQKSQLSWPFAYFREIDALDATRSSDVKFPWELSRMQWLLPLAQAWQLTGDERYARCAKAVIDEWVDANPYGWGVNWTCTMEPAMRVFTLCWLYGALASANSWQDAGFRFRLLRTLYLHLHFVRRFIEVSDVNGNHLIADASALVLGGVFFGNGRASTSRWQRRGWKILSREIDRQVYADGVNYEGSTSYHRLVAELLHLAADAIAGERDEIPAHYRNGLLRMADYVEAYTRPDGLAPVVGDNDNARVLPFGSQSLRDHRFVSALIYRRWAPNLLSDEWQAVATECLWWWNEVPSIRGACKPSRSRHFPVGGVCVLRSSSDYVFFACGPLGLAGRGGHSHNDALSFEAVLDGCSVIVDPGCFVYSGDFVRRNEFRATAVHSTPQLCSQEINRFISPRELWFLHHDASPRVEKWADTERTCSVVGSHDGYMRLASPARVIRSMSLDKIAHRLEWSDRIEPDSGQPIRSPLQLDPRMHVEQLTASSVVLTDDVRRFELSWRSTDAWTLQLETGEFAPQYGVVERALRLVFSRSTAGAGDIFFVLRPLDTVAQMLGKVEISQ